MTNIINNEPDEGASNIVELRRLLGMSQSQLAREILTDNNHISAWENGRRKPSYDNCLKLIEIAEKRGIKIDAAYIRPDKEW